MTTDATDSKHFPLHYFIFFPLYTNFYFLIFKWMMTTVPQAVGLLCV